MARKKNTIGSLGACHYECKINVPDIISKESSGLRE
jgi:hypothetical protein